MKCQIYALGRAGRALNFSLEKIPLNPPFSKGETDILFLSVPDDAIAQVASELGPPYPRCVAHLSGVHSYQILQVLSGKTALAQFHPLAALNGDGPIPVGSLCAINSDQVWAAQALHDLALSIGLRPVNLNPDKTIQYHAAAVITGNLSLALVSQSIELMQEAGIDKSEARKGLALLLRSAADNLLQKEVAEALTGPIARRDIKTIEKHLSILRPELRSVYQILCKWLKA